VNIDSDRYAIARRYMIRLRREDFADPHEVARYAVTANLTEEEFREQFEYVTANEPPPIRLRAAETGTKDGKRA
jgi:6-phosphofructokinase 1